MRSLWQFIAEKKPQFAIKFDLKYRETLLSEVSQKVITSEGIVEAKCTLLCLPLFSVELMPRIFNELQTKQSKRKP